MALHWWCNDKIILFHGAYQYFPPSSHKQKNFGVALRENSIFSMPCSHNGNYNL